MSLFIQSNHGTINHIENSVVTISNGQTTVEPEKQTAPYQPPIPKENDYNAVREYIAERKKYDEAFRIYWDSHNLKQNCVYLTREFGWIVDDHSLGTNLNRHR